MSLWSKGFCFSTQGSVNGGAETPDLGRPEMKAGDVALQRAKLYSTWLGAWQHPVPPLTPPSLRDQLLCYKFPIRLLFFQIKCSQQTQQLISWQDHCVCVCVCVCVCACTHSRALENLRFLFMPVGWGHTGEWYSIILPLKGCPCDGVNRTSPVLLPYLLSRFQCFSHKRTGKRGWERRENTWIFCFLIGKDRTDPK